ncbi:LpqB family beta-propeller domain-containing protein [Sphingosinicella soli]|uniref:Tol biopolymer transport system component n=1 Tax=Sphingosinicella soli TaxID=333708 RepID=A0A7W7F5M9_9SPHN|nr:LpqB family beta-propeller domain-containing protein [Sphingosinicella soli]MBB4630844.1 Tol biopolymer transport system component [Sphingosinicella soli]
MPYLSTLRAIRGATALGIMMGIQVSTAQGTEILTSPARDVALTLTEGTWMSVDVSPDGKTILFDLLNDVYAMPATGGQAKAILSGPATQRSPQFSPDGRHILFLSDEDGADNIWIADTDGRNARQISRETVAMITAPTWAPDGRAIAATKTSASVFEMRTSEIRRFEVSGGGDTGIVEAPASGKDIQEPRYAPDGRSLYYTERVGGTHYVYHNPGLSNFVIRRRDLVSGKTSDLISGFGSATSPQISPDGTKIAFIRRVGAKTVLFRYDIEARIQTAIYQDLDRDLQADYLAQEHYYPAFDWFPDNIHVAIGGKGKLYKVNMQTGAASEIPFRLTARHRIHDALRTRLDLAPKQVEAKIIRQISPSPDGRTLLFRALGALWQQDMEGSAPPRRLTQGTGVETNPVWAADGRSIAYVDWNDETGSTLRVRDARGGRERVIASSRGIIGEPVFSNNGKSIAYRILDPDSAMGGASDAAGLYVVDMNGTKPRFLAKASGVARFSPDDSRVYFMGTPDYAAKRAVNLRSIAVADGQTRDHAYAETADTGDFTLSPDLKWIAFKEEQELHVMPFPTAGETAAKISARGNSSARKLTRSGGFDMAWSADSRQLYWVLGPNLFSTSPDDAGTVGTATRKIAITATADQPSGVIAFTNARILPMSGGDTVIPRGTVVVEGNRIKSVGAESRVQIPANAKTIDLAGRTLMPGLFDAHGHIDCCYGTGVMPQKHPTRYAALAYGVTTNFDPYANELSSYETGEMTIAGKMVGPRWITTGNVIYGRAGKPDRVFNQIRSLEDARAITRRKAAITDGAILKSYKLTTRAQKQWLLEAAAETGQMVDAEGAGHFYDNVSMILDGYTNLEHNLPVATYYDDLLQLFKNSQMSMTPTLIVTFGELFGENYIYQHQEPWKESKVRTFIPGVNNAYNPVSGPSDAPLYVRAMQSIHQADALYDVGFRSVGRSIKRLDDAGVTVNVGSHGQSSGIAIHWEMQLLAEGGMTQMRILRAATINGAKTFGLDHQLGSIEPGKLADLIVLDRDPLVDIKNTNSVRYTMVNGRLYDSETMNEIGNHPRERSRFFWELTDQNGIDWNPAWGEVGRER